MVCGFVVWTLVSPLPPSSARLLAFGLTPSLTRRAATQWTDGYGARRIFFGKKIPNILTRARARQARRRWRRRRIQREQPRGSARRPTASKLYR